MRCVNIMFGTDDCWTDHGLIRSTMSIKLKRNRRIQKKQIWRRLNLDSLHEPATQQRIQVSLGKSLQLDYPDNVEDHWNPLKSTIPDACTNILGHKTRKHLDWFDENDIERERLISKKWDALHSWQNDISCKAKRLTHSKAKSAVRIQVRELKNSWWTDKAEIQRLADAGDTRGLFSATKAIYGPSYRGLNPLRSKDGRELLRTMCPSIHIGKSTLRNSSTVIAQPHPQSPICGSLWKS